MKLGKLVPDDSAPVFLRCMRETRGLTRADLAKRAGISEQTVRRVESAKRPLWSLAVMAAWADALGIGRVLLVSMLLRDYESGQGGWS
ncbi:helix-turn-helix domain-containing protein [Amycolatopsis sp. cg5]|uniref:helix-turn-helix domain-containing protein n=1 Tax=Amycolatopsis sp. cg5 TaxID=3238802 RepID=UPI0035265B9C